MLEGAQWVKERMEQGGRVLIHCEHGVGRSALTYQCGACLQWNACAGCFAVGATETLAGSS